MKQALRVPFALAVTAIVAVMAYLLVRASFG
jgi:hypothetical protein